MVIEATVISAVIRGFPFELLSNTTVWLESGTPPLAGPPLTVDQFAALNQLDVPGDTQ